MTGVTAGGGRLVLTTSRSASPGVVGRRLVITPMLGPRSAPRYGRLGPARHPPPDVSHRPASHERAGRDAMPAAQEEQHAITPAHRRGGIARNPMRRHTKMVATGWEPKARLAKLRPVPCGGSAGPPVGLVHVDEGLCADLWARRGQEVPTKCGGGPEPPAVAGGRHGPWTLHGALGERPPEAAKHPGRGSGRDPLLATTWKKEESVRAPRMDRAEEGPIREETGPWTLWTSCG